MEKQVPEIVINFRPADAPRCDFCSEQPVLWDYPSKDFVVKGLQNWSSDGHWAACQTCHDLIEAGRYAELAERSVGTAPAAIGRPLSEAELTDQRAFINSVHRQFRESRLGEPVRYGGTA
jgi:hypothetical protein